MLLSRISVVLLVLVASCDVPVTSAQKAKACGSDSPVHRQFDFWIGTWRVTEKGKLAGHNRIEAIDGGCALLESWRGVGGLTGHSLNIYDAKRGVWHQTWVDSSGSLLLLEGSFKNGAMVLEGGDALRERITWTALPGGEVRQRWESSSDGGKQWTTAFDGLYVRIGEDQMR